MRRGLRADTLTSAMAIAIAGYIVHQGLDLGVGAASDPGSGFILFWTGLIMIGLSGVVFVQSLLPSADATTLSEPFRGIRWGKVLYVVALMVVYAAVLEDLGFILATAALLLILFKTVDPQSWTVAIVGSVLTTGVAWLVFVYWLGTQLPSGILGRP